MSGCIVKVWFDADHEGRDRRAGFLFIETSFPDFESFCLAVDANRLIGGAILWTRRSGENEQVITRRDPIAFRGAAVLRCVLPTWTYVEEVAA
jgi:hypothetical protein